MPDDKVPEYLSCVSYLRTSESEDSLTAKEPPTAKADQAHADKDAIESALRRIIAFVDPKPPARPVLALTQAQIEEFTGILTECYRCLWSEHPGKI